MAIIDSWDMCAPKHLRDLHQITEVVDKGNANAIKAGWYGKPAPIPDYYAHPTVGEGLKFYYELGKRARELVK